MAQFRKVLFVSMVLIGVALIAVACTSQTVEVTREVPVTVSPGPTAPPAPTVPPAAKAPFEEVWAASAHNKADAEAFKHWDAADPKEVPTSCAKCHSTAGYIDFAADGKVDAAVPAPAGTITCAACHNEKAVALTSVVFPSGLEIKDLGPEARCMQCHQGRESKVSVDKQIADFKATDLDAVVAPMKDKDGKDVKFGFRNVHYLAAGATLYGTQAKGGYEYNGKLYDPKFEHADGLNTCISCHDNHSLEIKLSTCQTCHTNVKAEADLKNIRMEGSGEDYNGNGDTKEGIAAEIAGLQDTLYKAIQAYAKDVAKSGLVYDGATYPYFLADADGDGKADQKDGAAVAYSAWTPRLLKAAYNYQFSLKDLGAFAHNGKYIIELLYDSTADLNTKLAAPVDMSKMHREDAGHFAGSTMPFRDWDETGVVPAGCARCHSAEGLPTYLNNAGTLLIDSKGGLQVTGIVGQPTANGFACTTCHSADKFPERLAVVNVPFPSGVSLTFSTEKDDKGNLKPVDSNLCLECHQGRQSTAMLNKALAAYPEADTPSDKITFKNIHYFAAGATLFGTDAKVAYEYDGQTYVGKSKHTGGNECLQCHTAHELTPQIATCTACHKNVKTEADLAKLRISTVDYDGDGDTTEGIASEITTLQEKLYAAIQTYAETKAGKAIVYDASENPYFFLDADKDGKADKDDKGAVTRYNAWTPRLLKAAYNYNYSIKEPGAAMHNPQYMIQVLYDSLKDVGGDVGKMTRPE